MFAVIAGASRVYAIEHGPMAEVAREITRRNGVEDRVTIINDWSTEATLPELADVLVTETIGNIGFEEGILTWVLDATKRLLKPDGTIVPERISLVAAAVESPHDYVEIARLRRPVYELDFSALSDLATTRALIVLISLTPTSTSPRATSQERTARISSTNRRTMAVKSATPRPISVILCPHPRTGSLIRGEGPRALKIPGR